MPLDFTAIDIETANGFKGSVCALGVVTVRDGRVVGREELLVAPPASVNVFDPRNTRVHGLTAEDVREASVTFVDAVSLVAERVAGGVVVAHNAAFDLGALCLGAQADGVALPSLRGLCTVKVSRRTFVTYSHSLPGAARAAGYQLQSHHRAGEDALAAAHIALAAARAHGARTVEGLAQATGLSIESFRGFRPGIDPLSSTTADAIADVARGRLPTQPDWA